MNSFSAILMRSANMTLVSSNVQHIRLVFYGLYLVLFFRDTILHLP